MSSQGLTLSEVVAILRSRGVSSDALDRILRENLDSEAVILMTDEQLSVYIPNAGDRICVRSRCEVATGPKPKPAGRSPGNILARLQERSADRAEERQVHTSPSENIIPYARRGGIQSNLQTILFGCLLHNTYSKDYKVVCEPKGGGTRRCRVDRNSGRDQLITTGKNLYFPGGESAFGHVSHYTLDVLDFVKAPLVKAISQMLKITCQMHFRAYLACKRRQESYTHNLALPMPDFQITRPTIEEPVASDSVEPPMETNPIKQPMPSTSSTLTTIEQPMPSTSFTLTPIEQIFHSTSTCTLLDISDDALQTDSEEEVDLPDLPYVDFHTEHMDLDEMENYRISPHEILHNLQNQITTTRKSIFNINRDKKDFWKTAKRGLFRKSFSPRQALDVSFTDATGLTEGAIDNGGPSREFLTLVVEHLATSAMFDKTSNGAVLSLYDQYLYPKDEDGEPQQKSDYYCAGLFLALSIVHGGPTPKFLSPTIYKLNANGPRQVEVELQNLPLCILRTALEAFCVASLSDKDKMLGEEPLSSAVDYAGLTGTITDNADAEKLVKQLCKWYLYDRSKRSINEFKDGLSQLRVLDAVNQHSEVLESIFCVSERVSYTARTFEAIFYVNRAESNSNRFQTESRILIWWKDMLTEIEEERGIASSTINNSQKLNFETILHFVTGAKSEPAIGWNKKFDIKFLHEKLLGSDGIEYDSKYPKANTCACILMLPTTGAKTYREFKNNCIDGFISGDFGFGFA